MSWEKKEIPDKFELAVRGSFLEKLLLLFLRGLFHFVFTNFLIFFNQRAQAQYSQGPSTLCEFFAHVHSSFWRTEECPFLVLLMGSSEFAVELYAFPDFLLFLLFVYLSSSTATCLCFLWPSFSYITTIISMSTMNFSLRIPKFLMTLLFKPAVSSLIITSAFLNFLLLFCHSTA